jgi:deazaflavin-dependent oxidoreductase (nitroreductase family)
VSEREAWNQKVIDEFRANAGQVGGMFEGIPLLLLHHQGAKSGAERISPLAYRSDGDGLVVFASNGGRTFHPAWYHNVVAHPEVTIEVGDDTAGGSGTASRTVTARVANGEERDRLWAAQKAAVPSFADYEANAGDRVIPVVVLEPAG